MLYGQRLDELRSYIDGLEADLAEVDAMLAAHAYKIDDRPAQNWPERSTMGKAIKRHHERKVRELERICL